MAAQSKLSLFGAPRERTIRTIVSDLTSLYLSNRTRISRAVWITLFVALVNRIRHAVSEQKAASQREAAQRASRPGVTSSTSEDAADELPKKKKKVELNREFFRALLRLLKIVVPGWRSKEMRLIISHSVFLVARTLISLKVAAMDGQIVKSLIKGNGREFLTRIASWMLIAIPATFTNSMVRLAWLDCRDVLQMLTVIFLAFVPPGRVVSELSHSSHPAHPRQVPVAADFLWHLGTRRPDKEPGPTHRGRRGQVFQQLGRAVQ